MKLSISNIAWSAEYDEDMYSYLNAEAFSGLEIAPTRIFTDCPYDKLLEAKEWSENLKKQFKLEISSMQSIWYGRQEKIFGTQEERNALIDYTKKAVDFAEIIGCRNLVFGCPRNRDTENIEGNINIAVAFFKEIGDYAYRHNTIIALEPNPEIYNTHFMNNIKQTYGIVSMVSSLGIKVNVDLGAMIYEKEDVSCLRKIKDYINHVHISEPYLNIIEKRNIHNQLFDFLHDIVYENYVSIEMKNNSDLNNVKETIDYVKTINDRFI